VYISKDTKPHPCETKLPSCRNNIEVLDTICSVNQPDADLLVFSCDGIFCSYFLTHVMVHCLKFRGVWMDLTATDLNVTAQISYYRRDVFAGGYF
jgi:hypothetical protein